MKRAPAATEEGRKPTAGSGEIEISESLQAEIREFGRAITGMNYYQILGVPPGATVGQLRDAFFQRTRRYHPDRYFGKQLGVYGSLLHEIYKRIAAAYDVLRDAELRAQYDRSSGLASHPAEAAVEAGEPESPPASASSAASAGPAAPRAGSLRARRGLRPRGSALQLLERQLALGRQRAPGLFDQAMACQERGDWETAAKRLRLAVALDPQEARYRATLEGIAARAREARAQRLVAVAEGLLARRQFEAALNELEEVADLRPLDHGLAARIAEIALEAQGDLERALRWTRRAIELAPERAPYRILLGRLLKGAGAIDAARRQFEEALMRSPENREVKAELRALSAPAPRSRERG